MDHDCCFHQKHVHTRLPRKVENTARLDVKADGTRWAAPLFVPSLLSPVAVRGAGSFRNGGASSDDADDDADDLDNDTPARQRGNTVRSRGNRRRSNAEDPGQVEAHHWLSFLINRFGATGGFEAGPYTYPLFSRYLTPLTLFT
jgi:hypothetical protein